MSFQPPLELILILVVGGIIVGAFLVYHKSTTIPRKYLGVTAYTTISIPVNGVGRIEAYIEGFLREVPACAIDGKYIGYRADVVIEDFREGVAFVRSWDAK